MKGELLEMSRKELSRVEILEKLAAKQLSQVEAGKQLGLSDRQVRRLQERYQDRGAEGLACCRRGRPSNNRLSEELKSEAMKIVEWRYKDFGPTLAHEKLVETHGLKLSVESLRQLMMKEGFWKGKTRKKRVIHQQRLRRCSVGELVQLDGSPHDWFEDRGEKCCLLVWVDDATSQLLHLRFEEVETTAGYFRGMKDYLKKHGCPLCLYSDRHGIFRQNQGSDLKEQADPQFLRALKELDIELICANSPQAKGRVERANGILQDRLVKELRLRGISDRESANRFLPEFIEDYNRRFSVEPKNPVDSHRRLLVSHEKLDLILGFQEYRKLSKNLELSYNNVIYQIQWPEVGYRLRGTSVLVCENLEGIVTLWHEEKLLSYTSLTKCQRRTEIVTSKEKNKRVDEAIHRRVSGYKPQPSTHPWKQAGIQAMIARKRQAAFKESALMAKG